METPVRALIDDEAKAVKLFFDLDGVHKLDGLYHIRGAICWPMPTDATTDRLSVTGVAIIGAQNIRTEVLYVMEEFPFVTVESMILSGKHLDGLAPWLSAMWSKYYCNRFFTNQPDEIQMPLHRQLLKSPAVQPKPILSKVSWTTDADGGWQVYSMVMQGKFKIQKEGLIHESFEEWETRPGTSPGMAARAAICLVNGIHQHPYRKKPFDKS